MKISVPGLVAKKTATGTRYYWTPSPTLSKAGWKSQALGRDIEAAIAAAKKRNEEVANWRTGGAKPRAIAKFVARATVDHVIAQYKADGYPRVKKGGRFGDDRFIGENTRIEYDSKLKAISAWAGSEPIAAITPDNVAVFRDALLVPKKGVVRLTTAHGTLRVLRTLCAYAKSKKFIETNPALDFDLPAPPPRQQVASPEARAALLAAADDAGEPNMALAMLLGWKIGQREGDLLRTLQTQYVEIPSYKLDAEVFASLAAMAPDGRVMGIRLRQGKTRVWIEVPVVADERTRIEAAIERARAVGIATLLYDERDNKTWTSGDNKERRSRAMYFQRRFAELRQSAADKAKRDGLAELSADLLDLQFRDFRRTCVVVLGELGLADQLIAAITGHSLDETKRILEVYMPRTTGMAARAIMMSAERDARNAKRKDAGA